jgi:hypothetical protein
MTQSSLTTHDAETRLSQQIDPVLLGISNDMNNTRDANSSRITGLSLDNTRKVNSSSVTDEQHTGINTHIRSVCERRAKW